MSNKIFDRVVTAVGKGSSDAHETEEGIEKWTYNIEHKKMKDGRKYRVVIYELEDEAK
jgi:hypothetical protein